MRDSWSGLRVAQITEFDKDIPQFLTPTRPDSSTDLSICIMRESRIPPSSFFLHRHRMKKNIIMRDAGKTIPRHLSPLRTIYIRRPLFRGATRLRRKGLQSAICLFPVLVPIQSPVACLLVWYPVQLLFWSQPAGVW